MDPAVGQVAEGKTLPFETEEAIKTDELKTFEFGSKKQLIVTDTKEFSAVCPFSGLPDIAYLRIKYYPRANKCIELKSLKYYILSFRNVGLYQEGVTARIYRDLKELLGLKEGDIEVYTHYNVRGGFDTFCTEGVAVEPARLRE